MSIKDQLTQFHLSQQDRMLDFFNQSHARVGLGHTGGHLKLTDWLNFQAGFAQAKDAVFSQFDMEPIKQCCTQLQLDYLQVSSQAPDPAQFLQRPDLGKLLASESHTLLEQTVIQQDAQLLLVISGGLSPLAIQHHIPHFLPELMRQLQPKSWRLAPIILTPRSRVALGDELNYYFKAQLTVMLIGERPGLTTPDSLGIYLTYQAKPGCTDEQRYCISNIHAHGLSYSEAATKLIALAETVLTPRKKEFSS